MAKRDYYEVLGVNKNATPDEIKKAYRQMAKKYHPDSNSGDKSAEEKFKEVNEANEVLSDANKKAQYDQFGHAAFDPSAGAGGGGFNRGGGYTSYSTGGIDIDLDDILGSFFGGGFSGATRKNSNGPVRGKNIAYRQTLTFEEAAFGCRKELHIEREEPCEVCNGTGARPGSEMVTCSKCNGTGKVSQIQHSLFGGAQRVTTVCSECGGSGKVVAHKCESCRGSGVKKKRRKITINVPAGVDDGQAMTMRSEGNKGRRGGANGDLEIHFTVKPHKLFVRRGFDLNLDMKVPYGIAVLGGKVSIPTLKEDIMYDIPAGIQPGKVIVLNGKGIKHINSDAYGDLKVRVNIEVPTRLNDHQKELLKQYDDSFGRTKDGKPGKKASFFEKVKGAFDL